MFTNEQLIEMPVHLDADADFRRKHTKACYMALMNNKSIDSFAWADLDKELKSLLKRHYEIHRDGHRVLLGKEKSDQEIKEIDECNRRSAVYAKQKPLKEHRYC